MAGGPHDRVYDHLQQRLDRMPIGAPPHRALFEILRELYAPDEAALGASMPFKPASVERIARRAGLSPARAQRLLDGMLRKGLVVDLPRPDGRVSWILNPTVVGFFEFSMMRLRDDVSQPKLAVLMWEYFRQDPDLAFLRMLGEGPTFIARPLVHEDALEPVQTSEILDWESATALVSGAEHWAEGICHCRHVKQHLGKRCDYPLEHCLALGMGAQYLVRAGIAKPIEKAQALDILAYAREHDCVQMVDNVRKRPTFVCNCCSCCCEMLEGFRVLQDRGSHVTSHHVAEISEEACTGCGACVEACPLSVIELPRPGAGAAPERPGAPRVDEDRCLGCGVCRRHCAAGALRLRRTPPRVHTPVTTIEKILRQALERGKLPQLLFDDTTKLTHRVLGTVLTTLLELPPAKRLLAREQVKSQFVDLLLGGFKRTRGGWTAKL